MCPRRRILTDEERKQRKRDAWAKLDENCKRQSGERRGTPDDWKKAFFSKLGKEFATDNENLCLLGLKEMPSTLKALTRAWKTKMREVHPDREGGSHEACVVVNAAYEELTNQIKKEQVS